jgi:amidohydrolase
MLNKARTIQDQLLAWRRDFHMHPELGFHELRTSTRVAETLETFGYRVRRGVGRTGVVGEIGSGSPVFAIRADMDALPLQESTGLPYASCVPSVMHACGHDAHTAMALGAAMLLSGEQFPGTVRFLFQPCEEANDADGFGGAARMIEQGAIDGVDMIIAQHVDVTTPVGKIEIEAGPSSGGVDSFFGKVLGRGGHGARPNDTVDPIYLSAFVILAINGIISRRMNPFDPAVVSLGAIHAGQAENVIPEFAEFAGTLRYTEHRVQEQIHAEIQHAFELARPLGGDYELRFQKGTPPMINHPAAVELIQAAASDVIGGQNVLPFEKGLGAEDFGCFLDAAPGAMFSLGARPAEEAGRPHSSTFRINEDALPVGTAILVEAALRYLRKNAPENK